MYLLEHEEIRLDLWWSPFWLIELNPKWKLIAENNEIKTTSSGRSWLARNIRLANFGWFKSKANDRCSFNDDKRWLWLARRENKYPMIIFERKFSTEPVTKASRRYNDRSSSSSQTRAFLHCVTAKWVINDKKSSVRSLPNSWWTKTFNSRRNMSVNVLWKRNNGIVFVWSFHWIYLNFEPLTHVPPLRIFSHAQARTSARPPEPYTDILFQSFRNSLCTYSNDD